MVIVRNILIGLVTLGFWLSLTPQSTQAQIYSEYWVYGSPVTIDRGGPLRNFFGRIHDRWHGVQYFAPVEAHRVSWFDPCCDICCCVPLCWNPCCYYFPASPVYFPPLTNSFHSGRGFESTVTSGHNRPNPTQWMPSQPNSTIDNAPDKQGGSVLEKENAPEPPPTNTPEKVEALHLPGSFDRMLTYQNQTAPQPQVAPNESLLELSVPADAQVEINGRPTRSTGSNRKFSVQLKDLLKATPITVHASIRRDGQTFAHTEEVRLRGGSWLKTSIAESDLKATIQTTLIVKLPSSAQLSLAGTTLPPGKEFRTFATRNLEAGKVWADYCVRAEIEQNGELVVIERFIDVVAGEEHVVDLFPLLEDAAVAKR